MLTKIDLMDKGTDAVDVCTFFVNRLFMLNFEQLTDELQKV